MSLNQAQTIYPCPFSKAYGISSRQAWILLKVFLLYRFITASSFLIVYYSALSKTVIDPNYLQLYNYTSKIYVILAILSGISSFWRFLSYTLQTQIVIFTDIIVITLLMHACGGVSSGIGILLSVTLAAAGLLIGGRCSMVFAAIATTLVLSENLYTIRFNGGVISSYSTSGMLGATFFITALFAYILAKRSEQSDLLANQQKQTITSLEELNQSIVQHLQSGIIIINKQQKIYITNESALVLLNVQQQTEYLKQLSSQLSKLFISWSYDTSQDFMTLSLSDQVNIYVRFSLFNTRYEMFYMLILEDINLYHQRLQQKLLASLGRLTTNIAHEIRNPLSAISHAGQLLSENPKLEPQDLRLTEIIQTHSTRVNKIINDILQASKQNKSCPEKILLNQWLVNYLADFTDEYGILPAKLQLNLPSNDVYGLIDQGHLKQILDNLCQNALKYGQSEQGKIELNLSCYELIPCIEVLDHGTELEKSVANQLFEPFFTTSNTGTGLGLYISRELAETNQAKLSYSLNSQQKNSFKLCLYQLETTRITL